MKEEPKPRPTPPEVKDDPRVVAHRCPFCHEPVRPDEEAWVACAQCLGRQHAACWDEATRCGACGHDRRLEAAAERPAAEQARAAPRRSLVPVLLAVVFVLMLLGMALATVSVSRSDDGSTIVVPSPPRRVFAEVAEFAEAAEVAEVAPGRPAPAAAVDHTARRAALRDRELEAAPAAERARLLGAVGLVEPGAAVAPQEAFRWIPDHAEDNDVARRLVREHRERALSDQGSLASLVLLAHVDAFTGNHAQAVRRCEQALDRDPHHGPAWTARGWARLALGQLDGAELDLLRGLELSADPTWALVGLGRLAEERGWPDEALARYEQARAALADSPTFLPEHAADLGRRLERLRRAR
ncbi:MAG: tetratricopeptide repeat protein [Planctomycetes bacterium]|nr:tetratricopeptide repeat protein [Planctomycetota bacterium]